MTPEAAPWFVLVGGINGAGKSTFSQDPELLRRLVDISGVDSIEVINPDTVTRAIREANPGLSLSDANRDAANQCADKVRALIEARNGHFVIETVLASEKYKSIVARALELEW